MGITLHDTLAVFGNSNYIGGYITYFEEQIVIRNETQRYLEDCPNYYAWLLLASEHVYYRIRELLYFNRDNEEAFDDTYRKLMDALLTDHSLSKKDREDILLFARIRHLLVHKGFPNPHRAPAQKNRLLASGIGYSEDDVTLVCERIRRPAEFTVLRQSFHAAMAALRAVEKEVNLDFGIIIFQKTPKKSGV